MVFIELKLPLLGTPPPLGKKSAQTLTQTLFFPGTKITYLLSQRK